MSRSALCPSIAHLFRVESTLCIIHGRPTWPSLAVFRKNNIFYSRSGHWLSASRSSAFFGLHRYPNCSERNSSAAIRRNLGIWLLGTIHRHRASNLGLVRRIVFNYGNFPCWWDRRYLIKPRLCSDLSELEILEYQPARTCTGEQKQHTAADLEDGDSSRANAFQCSRVSSLVSHHPFHRLVENHNGLRSFLNLPLPSGGSHGGFDFPSLM